MNLSTIQDMWNKDCKINILNLDKESIRIPELHSKYFNILNKENLILKKRRRDLKIARRRRWEFYMGKGTADDYQREPFDLKVLKSDVEMYMESDPELNELIDKIEIQEQKVDMLKAIISSINSRNWEIRNAIEWHKFTNGVN